jgi:hypothetical protein
MGLGQAPAVAQGFDRRGAPGTVVGDDQGA